MIYRSYHNTMSKRTPYYDIIMITVRKERNENIQAFQFVSNGFTTIFCRISIYAINARDKESNASNT